MSDLNWSDYENFSREELACHETGECDMDPHFMNRLQGMRRNLGRAMNITSGYRSPQHSIESAKDQPGSHAQGHAVDVKCKDSAIRFQIIREALNMGFTGIGVSKDFIHLDDMQPRQHASRPCCWVY
jgi:zinc D-Ala-D-Ala carboxypeptidase